MPLDIDTLQATLLRIRELAPNDEAYDLAVERLAHYAEGDMATADIEESASSVSTSDMGGITGHRLTEEGGEPDLEASEALANLHAAVLNALEAAGDDTETYAATADDELDGSGWNLARSRQGGWHAVRDTEEVQESGDWDESKHPRDGGKFTSAGGGDTAKAESDSVSDEMSGVIRAAKSQRELRSALKPLAKRMEVAIRAERLAHLRGAAEEAAAAAEKEHPGSGDAVGKFLAGYAREVAKEMTPNIMGSVDFSGGGREDILAAIADEMDDSAAAKLASEDMLHSEGPGGAHGLSDFASESDIPEDVARSVWTVFAREAFGRLAGKKKVQEGRRYSPSLTELLEAGGERSPAGGVTLNGKHYPGGQFIPGKAIAAASPEDKAKLEKAKADSETKAKAKSAERKAKPVDRASLADRLSRATGGRKLLPSQERSAAASWRMLQRFHGDEALHRVQEIADAAEAALGKLDKSHPAAVRLRQRLGELAWMAGQEEAPAEKVADEAKATPPIAPGTPPTDTAQPQPNASPVAATPDAGAKAAKGGGDDATSADGANVKPVELTRDEIRKLLAEPGDRYKDHGVEKSEIKGYRRDSGDPIMGYPYSPHTFHKSHATGMPIRHYVKLPDGQIVHPDELRDAIKRGRVKIKATPQEMEKQERNKDWREAIRSPHLHTREQLIGKASAAGVSTAERAEVTREHTADVGRAVAKGDYVPEEVLADVRFTGTDSQGRQWVNGELVARQEQPQATSATPPGLDEFERGMRPPADPTRFDASHEVARRGDALRRKALADGKVPEVDEGKAWQAASAAWTKLDGMARRNEIPLPTAPKMYELAKQEMPELTRARFYDLLEKWQKDDRLTMQVVNDPHMEPEAHLMPVGAPGSSREGQLLGYLEVRPQALAKSGESATPAPGKPPTPDAPQAATNPADTPGTPEHFKATVLDPMQASQQGKPLYPQQVERLAARYNARHGTTLDVTRKTPPVPTGEELKRIHAETGGKAMTGEELQRRTANKPEEKSSDSLTTGVDSKGASAYATGGDQKPLAGDGKMTKVAKAVHLTPREEFLAEPHAPVGEPAKTKVRKASAKQGGGYLVDVTGDDGVTQEVGVRGSEARTDQQAAEKAIEKWKKWKSPEAVHKDAVARAARAGFAIPAEVLADYPDIKQMSRTIDPPHDPKLQFRAPGSSLLLHATPKLPKGVKKSGKGKFVIDVGPDPRSSFGIGDIIDIDGKPHAIISASQTGRRNVSVDGESQWQSNVQDVTARPLTVDEQAIYVTLKTELDAARRSGGPTFQD